MEREPILPPEKINLSEFVENPHATIRQANRLHLEIARTAIASRGIEGAMQYGPMFLSFWVYRIRGRDRARALKSSYFWLRHADDIADGDKPLPRGYSSKEDFLLEKKGLARKILTGSATDIFGDKEDVLLLDFAFATRRLNIDLSEETLAILDTIIFDEERSRTGRLPKQAELDDYFDKLDFACVEGGLKLAGENYNKEEVADITMAVRTMFNLRDITKDMRAGIINISSEDIESYGIDLDRCKNATTLSDLLNYDPIRRWYTDQMLACSDYLERSEKSLAGIRMKPETRFALSFNSKRVVRNKLRKLNKLLAQ